uniref:Uncharacterized protein n=1 Tax=Nicotiana tabacum TaxID=4097 RepID=A0A1S4A095_TOBAC|nr:PREDICTED: uncharacterized protein LOC107792360 [Nicotiana tabacum]
MLLHMRMRRRLGRFLKEQRGRLYIMRRCVIILLCWHD